MRKTKPKERERNPENTGDVWQRAFGDMCVGLDKFGSGEILDLLVTNAHRDRVVFALLTTYPRVVATVGFLSGFRYNIKVSKRLFKKLQREHCIL